MIFDFTTWSNILGRRASLVKPFLSTLKRDHTLKGRFLELIRRNISKAGVTIQIRYAFIFTSKNFF